MQHKTFTLKGENIIAPVSEFVRFYYQEAFLSEYLGGFLMVYEDYSFLNSNQLMICLRVDSTAHQQGIIKIEMISGGGSGDLLLGEVLGSEKRRISHFAERLQEFCREKGIVLEM
jgi:histidinol phosphatase-like PHP family hydrolase